ncbi:ferritin-like domain-containing protein [Thermobifida halotolerans]|uniref:Ferritin-like domain-containing protein n=1 Tax=Thermobifida halotolerans TaxID=483545 RepID=A0A399G4V6_9ACTN|nr:ferritin-like domain-containing protein [Thermobifida halotolerans]UOE19867.1 ferritin-like domain-containing protein [Thermobifida halotolerans]
MTGTPDPTPTDPADAAVAALRDALLAEHAAVYGYGFAASRIGSKLHDLCLAHLEEHRAGRDALHAELVARGSVPPGGEDAYALPEDTGPEALAAFAVGLEETTAQAYLELAAVSVPGLRDLAGRALGEATLRVLALGSPLSVFPGFPGGEL